MSRHNRAGSWEESSEYIQGPSRRADLGRRLHSDEIVIGLALGSPSQNPLPPLPQDDRDVDGPYNGGSPEPPSVLGTISEISAGAPGIKRKGSKWKSLGGLFGRKHSSSQSSEMSPFYQLDQVLEQGPAKQSIHRDHLETNVLRRKRADTAQSVRDNKLQSPSAQIAAKAEEGGLLRRNSSRRKGLRRKKVEELKPEMQNLYNALSAHATAEAWTPPQTNLRPIGGSLLQVEIPNVEMERYSVMFEDVLDSKPQSKPPASLLSRRHLEQLEPITSPSDQVDTMDTFQPDFWLTEAQQTSTEELPKPHRRDDSTSSKSSTKSPSFSLFPPSPRGSAANRSLPRPSPLSRSTTTPNTTLTPPQPKIHKTKSQDRDQVFVIVHTPTDSPSTPTAHGRMPSFGPPAPSANSTQASFFECEEYPGYTFEEDPPTPTSAKSPKDTFLQRAFPARKDSIKKLNLAKSEACLRHQADEPVSTVAAAAEVSVARQISISRRQRQMLVPIAQARQPMRPTLVNARSTSALRKSHHPTLSDG